MAHKFIKTKIILSTLLIGFSAPALLLPVNSFFSNMSNNYSTAQEKAYEAKFNQGFEQIKKYDINIAKKEVEKAQIDASHGIDINKSYEIKNMQNFYHINQSLSQIQGAVNQINIENNRYLVPNFFSSYTLPQNLAKHYNVNIKGISTLATKANSEGEYLLNFYQNKQQFSQEKIDILNNYFKDNLKTSQDINQLVLNNSTKSQSNNTFSEQLNWEQFENIYNYVSHMQTDTFLKQAHLLQDTKNIVNQENYWAEFYSQLISSLGIFLLTLGALLMPLGLISYSDKIFYLFSKKFKYIKEMKKYNKGAINYKKTQMDRTYLESLKYDIQKSTSFLKKYQLKQTSKFGLATFSTLMAGYYLVHLTLRHEMLPDPFNHFLYTASILSPIILIFTHFKNIDLNKRLERSKERLKQFKMAQELSYIPKEEFNFQEKTQEKEKSNQKIHSKTMNTSL